MSATKPGLGRRIAGFFGTLIGVAAITFLLGEVSSRAVLGIRPLSEAREIYRAHPRWGWALAPGSAGDFVKLGARQRVEINGRGLRERDIPYERTPGVTRVLVLGDSAVIGMEVPQDAVFPRVAERALAQRGFRVEFVNGGVRGWGSDQSLLFLLDEGLRYRPDVVLYFWNENDVDDNQTVHRPFREFGKAWFSLDEQGALVLRGTPVPAFELATNLRVDERGDEVSYPVSGSVRAQMWLRDNLVMRTAFGTALAHVVAAVPQLTATVMKMGTYGDFKDVKQGFDTQSAVFRTTAAIVREMDRATREGGGAFFLIGSTSTPWNAELRRATGVRGLDEMPEFARRLPKGEPFLVPFDTHWNALGHEVYGQVLAERLEAAGVVGPGGVAPGAAAAAP